MLLVHREIIATKYRSTIFKTHVFSLHSHLCIYIATHLHTVYLDWQQVEHKGDARCAWKSWLGEFRDTLQGRYWVSIEVDLEAVIKCSWRYTWRPSCSKFGDTFRRPSSGEISPVLGGGWWTVHPVLSLYSLVSWLATMEMWQADSTFKL